LQVFLIFDAGAGGVAEGEAAALVALGEEVFEFSCVVAGVADVFVSVLG
jgi:hypothetical protein